MAAATHWGSVTRMLVPDDVHDEDINDVERKGPRLRQTSWRRLQTMTLATSHYSLSDNGPSGSTALTL